VIRVSVSLLLACSATAWGLAPGDLPHRVHVEGQGSVTVVLESGLGDTLDVWKDVQPQIASGCARTVSYNRAGYLGSDPSDSPRDAAVIVAELRAELKYRHIAPPYVLVGHSLGGLYMQYFARNFPAEVAGLLLVDSTHWDQGLADNYAANTPYAGRTVTLFMPWIMRREVNDSTGAGREVHESAPAGSVPTIVLASTIRPHNETPEGRARADRLQDEIAADFPAARRLQVEQSGHYIQRDRPDIVIASARKLAGCGPE
jgi:pimeloyl-ACP methyl ester carboxylesterase